MRIFTSLLALALIAAPAGALARGHHSGGYHSGGHHSSSHHGHVYGFRTSQCKSASCYRKHPNGKYVHPLTTRKHP
jgi:hypothetical protein